MNEKPKILTFSEAKINVQKYAEKMKKEVKEYNDNILKHLEEECIICKKRTLNLDVCRKCYDDLMNENEKLKLMRNDVIIENDRLRTNIYNMNEDLKDSSYDLVILSNNKKQLNEIINELEKKIKEIQLAIT